MSLYDIFIIGQGPRNAASNLAQWLKQRLRDLGVDPDRHARVLSTKDVGKRSPLVPSVAVCLLPFKR
jgi:hypothetical protein